MYKLIMVTEEYMYYSNDEQDVKMYDKNKKLVAKHTLAINNMLLELERIQYEEINCEFMDEHVLQKFIMEYW